VSDSDRAGHGARLGRLHWRLRGAWLWPTFVAATVLEGGLLHALPVQGESTGWVGGTLAAGCLNLVCIVVAGTIGGRWLRRRRPDMPRVVAENYAGTAVLGIVAAGLVAAGLVHHTTIARHADAFAEQSLAVRRWVALNGDAYERAHVSRADSLRVDEDLYRTCVPRPDPKRALCLIVDTTQLPPTVKRDASSEPNTLFNARGAFR